MAITVGSVANFSSGQAVYYFCEALDTNKVVLVYRDQDASSATKIVIGTVSGTNVSWGTAAVINSGYYLDRNVTGIAVLSSRLVVVCFYDNSSTTSQVVACTISGTTITVGTPISIGNYCENPRISALSSTSFVLAYRNRTTTYGGTVVGTVSTRTITLGDFVSCGYDFGENLYHTVIGLDSTHFALSYQYRDFQYNTDNWTVLGTISSGTTHSLGSRAKIKRNAFNGKIKVAKLSSTKFVYVYYGEKAVVCSYSGTTITVGSEQSLSDDIYTASYLFDVGALSEDLVIIGGYGSSYKKFIAYTVDGTTLTKEGDATNIETTKPDESFCIPILTSTKFVGTWTINNSYGRIVVADYSPPVVTPTVTTQNASSITQTKMTGNGNITATGGANCTRRGFCYKAGTSGDPTTSDSVAYDDGSFGTGAFTKSITGLTAGTNYRVRAYAVNSAGTSYGTTVDVKTLSAFIPRTMWFN